MKTMFLMAITYLLIGYNSTEIYRVELSYIAMNIETFDGISCDDFDNEGASLTISITDQEIAKRIWDMTDELVPYKFSYQDIRRKLRIWKNGELRTACIGVGRIFFNGEIEELIEGLIAENDAKLDSISIVESSKKAPVKIVEEKESLLDKILNFFGI
jgi:hypothetical protein